MILKIVIWVILCYSVTSIFAESYIFKSFRDRVQKFSITLGIFVRCVLCTGTWISFIYSYLLWSPTIPFFYNEYNNIHIILYSIDISSYVSTFVRVFNDGVFGGAIIYFINVIENKLRK